MYFDDEFEDDSNINSNNIKKYITIGVFIIVIIALILLLFGGSKAKIKLIGDSKMSIYQFDKFIDPGYEIVGSDEGFYVNIDGVVDSNVIGTYYLEYLLYSANGSLVSKAKREIKVLYDDKSDILMYLKGENEEYFFVDDYIDHGAEAYNGAIDISNQIIIESNVLKNMVGKYEVKYQIKNNGNIKEVTRIVNIIDLNVENNNDYDNMMINFTINCMDYSYTILPDGTKMYSKYIHYKYKDIKSYEFDIYLKSGSHKKYVIDMANMDREGPVGTCSLSYSNNQTTITMKVTDKSGIKKYSYNGLEFYGNTTTINTKATNVKVRAYDNYNNYRDITCGSQYGTSFRNINVDNSGHIQGKSGYIVCNSTSFVKENQELDLLMQSYGYKTRDAVAAAGLYLATYKYDIPYFWGGKYVKKGLNPAWGCREAHSTDHGCSKPMTSNNSYCQLGLDCAGFTAWAFAQAGFDSSIIRKSGQSEGMWGNFNAQNHRFAFNSTNRNMADLIKPGDIVHKPGHVGLVIGVEADRIQVAEMTGPIIIDIINKNNGNSLNGQSSFDDFVLFEDFYKMYGNS